MGLKVLGPDVNESFADFTPNKAGQIRFGLAGIKGVGESAVEGLVKEREEKGPFSTIWDFAERVSQRSINKKTLESLAAAGAFDGFREDNLHRGHFFTEGPDNLIEKMIRFGNAKATQTNTSQTSLFGSMGFSEQISVPKIMVLPEMIPMEALQKEYDVVGFYISGHPLDAFKKDIDTFCNTTCNDLTPIRGKDFQFAGMVTNRIQKIGKNGNPYCRFTIVDYSGQYEIALFGKDYQKFESFGKEGQFIFIKGEFRPRYGSETELMFNIQEMILLEEVRSKFLKGLEIKIHVEQLETINLDALEAVMKRFPGGQKIRFQFIDSEEEIQADAYSRKMLVEPSNEFLDAMQKETGLEVLLK